MRIISSNFVKSCSNIDHLPHGKYPEFAVIGRSNVGKSSLINMILGKKGIAKASNKPGKTQLINYFCVQDNDTNRWYIVDLPGYGYAKASTKDRIKWMDTMYDYLTQRENLKRVFVLIDGNIPPQNIDIDFIMELMKETIPFDIIITKIDKTRQKLLKQNIDILKHELKAKGLVLPEIFLSSSKTGAGKEDILRYIAYDLKN